MCDKQMEYLKHELNTKLSDKQYTRHEILFHKNCDDKLFSIHIDCVKLGNMVSERVIRGYHLYTMGLPLKYELSVNCTSKEEVISTVESFIKDFERYGGLRLV